MKNLKNRAKKLLLSAGVNPSHMGFETLAEAIVLCYKDQQMIHNVTTKLYIILSERFEKNCGAVERNIRHSVSMACRDQETVCSVLNLPSNAIRRGSVNNKSFIAACVQVLKMEDEENEQSNHGSWSADR